MLAPRENKWDHEQKKIRKKKQQLSSSSSSSTIAPMHPSTHPPAVIPSTSRASTVAPLATSCRAMLRFPPMAAKCNGVWTQTTQTAQTSQQRHTSANRPLGDIEPTPSKSVATSRSKYTYIYKAAEHVVHRLRRYDGSSMIYQQQQTSSSKYTYIRVAVRNSPAG